MTNEFDTTAPLAAFRERLLTALTALTAGLETAPASPGVSRPRRFGRRGVAVAVAVGVLAAGSALAVTAERLTDISFFGANTPAQGPDAPAAPAVPMTAVAAAINRDPASGTGVRADQLRVVAEAISSEGRVQVVMGATAPASGEKAGAMCQAVVVDQGIRNAGCTFVAPTDDLWLGRSTDINAQADDAPGLMASFAIPNVGVITGYTPPAGVSGTLTVTEVVKPFGTTPSVASERPIPVGVVDGVWVALVTAEALGTERFDAEHSSPRTMRVEITDRSGNVIYRVANMLF